jgi:hypothetical protein
MNDETTERELASMAASAMGRLGGQAKSAAKTGACRRNGRLGGQAKALKARRKAQRLARRITRANR